MGRSESLRDCRRRIKNPTKKRPRKRTWHAGRGVEGVKAGRIIRCDKHEGDYQTPETQSPFKTPLGNSTNLSKPPKKKKQTTFFFFLAQSRQREKEREREQNFQLGTTQVLPKPHLLHPLPAALPTEPGGLKKKNKKPQKFLTSPPGRGSSLSSLPPKSPAIKEGFGVVLPNPLRPARLSLPCTGTPKAARRALKNHARKIPTPGRTREPGAAGKGKAAEGKG